MSDFTYCGPANKTGYGSASVQYLNALHELKADFSYMPIGDVDPATSLHPEIIEKCGKDIDFNKPVFCFWHLFDMNNKLSQFTGKKIGLTTIEVDTLSTGDIANAANLHKLATTNTYHADIMEEQLNTAVHIIRHGRLQIPGFKYEYQDFVGIWNTITAPTKLPENALVLSSCGKFEKRKSFLELIHACLKLDKPVVLVAYWFNPFIKDGFPYSEINKLNFYPCFTNSGAKVFSKDKLHLILMPQVPTQVGLMNSLSKADYFISPSKAEGWNLPLFDALTLGIPCIATNTSAHRDFITPMNSIVINNSGKEQAIDLPFFNGHSTWSSVTEDNILEALIKASNSRRSADNLGRARLATKTYETWTWKNETKKILQLVS